MPKGRGSNHKKGRKRKALTAAQQAARRTEVRTQRQRSHEAAEEYRQIYRPEAKPLGDLIVWADTPDGRGENVDPKEVAAGLVPLAYARDPDSGMAVPAKAQAPITGKGIAYAAAMAKQYAIQHGRAFVSDFELLVSVRWDGRGLTTWLEGHVVGTPVGRVPEWVKIVGHLIEEHGNERVEEQKDQQLAALARAAGEAVESDGNVDGGLIIPG